MQLKGERGMGKGVFSFGSLASAPLVVDAVYESGITGNAGDDPINQLLKVGLNKASEPEAVGRWGDG
jgi:hypothetical protein